MAVNVTSLQGSSAVLVAASDDRNLILIRKNQKQCMLWSFHGRARKERAKYSNNFYLDLWTRLDDGVVC